MLQMAIFSYRLLFAIWKGNMLPGHFRSATWFRVFLRFSSSYKKFQPRVSLQSIDSISWQEARRLRAGRTGSWRPTLHSCRTQSRPE